MTLRIDRTLPHHPAHALVLDTRYRRHTVLDDIPTGAAPRTQPFTGRLTHRHFNRRQDLR